MVFSSYSNFGTDLQNVNSEPIYQTKPVQDQLVTGDHQHLECSWDTFELPYAFLDPYIDLNNNLLHPENYTPLLPYFSPCEPLISFSPEIISFENFSSYPCPKRQKLIEDHYYCSDFVPALFDGVALNSCPEPGGNKMNTAEMLQSAFKYIKYLQAQVGILEVMDSFPVIFPTFSSQSEN